MCAEPLSTYPSYKLLSQLKVHQWVDLGVHFGLEIDQIESIRSSQNPSAEIFITAKKKNIDLSWKDVLEGLFAIGEYEVAESVCIKRGISCIG